MKFLGSAVFWLLLNDSASSLASNSNFNSNARSTQRFSSSTSSLTFIRRGGGGQSCSFTKSQLSASVDSPSQVMAVSSENLDVLSDRGREAIINLIENNKDGSQSHVYSDWPEAGVQDDDKRRLADQVSVHLFIFFSFSF